ncbi:MAG: type II toxin-antitoxin system prevent-host-death family antitoxin [Anaerolineae bacterium]|nr:type II toxin-antitoxin system prevent-host-death family antitoxin [Anaerolineae bacterium]
MSEVRVGTRELKNKLSEYLRRVKKGQTVIVTERGNVVAQLIPPQQTIEERIWAMVEAGLADWNGKKMKPYQPKIINRSGKLMSDIIMEDRR